MFLLAEAKVDRIIQNRKRFFLSGLMIFLIPFLLPKPWGISCSAPFTSFMLMGFGIYGFAFRSWRSDPGLWMLAVLITLANSACLMFYEYEQYRSLFMAEPGQPPRPLNWNGLKFVLDSTLALLIYSRVVKFAATVAIKNWKITKELKRK